jgi:hypothetical protein
LAGFLAAAFYAVTLRALLRLAAVRLAALRLAVLLLFRAAARFAFLAMMLHLSFSMMGED